jgi:hypothetical protein
MKFGIRWWVAGSMAAKDRKAPSRQKQAVDRARHELRCWEGEWHGLPHFQAPTANPIARYWQIRCIMTINHILIGS